MKNSKRLWILSICLIVAFIGSSNLFANDEVNHTQANNYVIFIDTYGAQPAEAVIQRVSDSKIIFSGTITHNTSQTPSSFNLDINETYTLRLSRSASNVHFQNCTKSGSGNFWTFTTDQWGSGGYISVSFK